MLVDVDADRVAKLSRGESYIEDVPSATLARLVSEGVLTATTDYDVVREGRDRDRSPDAALAAA